MKTLKIFGILCIMLCLTVSTTQAKDCVKKETHSQPFKATIRYSYSSYWSNGVGNATHLGSFTTVSYWGDSGIDNKGNVVTIGNDIFTAADGSQLFMAWSATLNYAAFTEDGTYVFTGGTGRFKDATGSGTLHAFAASSESDLFLIMTGTIAFNDKGDDGHRGESIDRGDDDHRGEGIDRGDDGHRGRGCF